MPDYLDFSMPATKTGQEWLATCLSNVLRSQDESQLGLAKKLGVGQRTISGWINQERVPNIEKIEGIAEFLGLLPGETLELLCDRILSFKALKVYFKGLILTDFQAYQDLIAAVLKERKYASHPLLWGDVVINVAHLRETLATRLTQDQLIELRNYLQELKRVIYS